MFKNNPTLKKEVLRYFTEYAISHIEVISNSFKKVLKEYKDEEKIAAIDNLVSNYQKDDNGLATTFKKFDSLCEREQTVFYTSGDTEEHSQITNLRVKISELQKSIEALINNNPTNKNEIILLQAHKINLFDTFFKETLETEQIPELSYFFYDFTIPPIEGDVIPGQKGFILTYISTFLDFLDFKEN